MLKSSFQYDEPHDNPGFLLWQTTIIWQRQIKQLLTPYELSHAQFVILANLLWFEEHAQVPNQILIVNQSKLDKMTVSQALKKLVTLRYVKRQEHKMDTRAKSVHLTAKGRSLAQEIVPKIEQLDEQYFSCLTKSERHALIQLLVKVVCSTESSDKLA